MTTISAPEIAKNEIQTPQPADPNPESETYELGPKQKTLKSVLDLALSAGCGKNVALLFGPPGTGKTEFAEYYSRAKNAELIRILCHRWLTTDELFHTPDLGELALTSAGISTSTEKSRFFTPGVLTLAAKSSLTSPTVLLLDELDKAPPEVEGALLSFLHNGLVQDPTHGVIRAKLNNLIVVITSNQTREHSKALLDRTYWTTFDYLDPHLERRIISERTHAPLGLVRLIVDMARILRNAPYTSKPSLRGMIALAELVPTTTSTSEVDSLVKGLLCDPALVSSDMAELSKKLLDTSRKPLNWAAALRGARR